MIYFWQVIRIWKKRFSGDKQDVRLKNEASISNKKDKDTAPISNEKKDIALSDKRDIAGFSQAEKLLSVLNLTIQKLPSALGSQLKALINPASIAVMVGVLGAYTASHAVGVGFIADAVMGVSAGLFLGWACVKSAPTNVADATATDSSKKSLTFKERFQLEETLKQNTKQIVQRNQAS